MCGTWIGVLAANRADMLWLLIESTLELKALATLAVPLNENVVKLREIASDEI